MMVDLSKVDVVLICTALSEMQKANRNPANKAMAERLRYKLLSDIQEVYVYPIGSTKMDGE